MVAELDDFTFDAFDYLVLVLRTLPLFKNVLDDIVAELVVS